MPYLEILRKLAIPAAVIALVLTIWFSGDHHGQTLIQAKWDAQKQRDRVALEAERERVFKAEQVYANQIARANSERDHNRSELARLAALPRARLLCHAAAPDRGPSSLPGLPATADPQAASDGKFPPQPESDRDISADLYAEADRADALVEAFRDYLNRVPPK